MSPHRKGRSSRLAGALLLGVLLASVTLSLGSRVASAAGERAGDVVVVDESGAPLAEGGSATVFGLRLPSGAACQGDSSDENYRIEGFLVPEGTDPGSLVYGEIAPEGEGNWGLWDDNTATFDGGLTSDADPGQPGLIVDVPNFSFGVLYPDELPAGEYRIGIACSLFDETTRYWDTSFVVVADASDQPAQFRWTASASDGSTSSDASSSALPVVVLVLALLVLLLVLFLALRLRSGRATPTKERSS